MLSRDAFNVASVIATGGLTVHDLKMSIATEGIAADRVNEFIHHALVELAKMEYLIWFYEPDYGNTQPVRPPSCDERELDRYWRLCFPKGGPLSSVPDSENPTIFIEHTKAMLQELNNPQYEPFLSS